jgi:hypothetical protein
MLITAEQARRLSTDRSEIMDTIYHAIDAGARQNKSSVTIAVSEIIQHSCKKELEEHGYTVRKYSSAFSDTGLVISWR